jgi:GTPase SAR1 family protein
MVKNVKARCCHRQFGSWCIEAPYSPDVDVRNYVDVGDLMEKYGLGPNGALIMAADLIADEIENLTRDIDEAHADIVLVDTPGQMELFAFRAGGPYIVNELSTEPKVMLYLFDSTFSANPLNYVSNVFLASAVQTRYTVPMLYVLSKTDIADMTLQKEGRLSDLIELADGSGNDVIPLEYAFDLAKLQKHFSKQSSKTDIML